MIDSFTLLHVHVVNVHEIHLNVETELCQIRSGWGTVPRMQEGGGVSKENIGLVISTSVTSRHTSVSFNMAGDFVVLFYRKNEYFPTIWMIQLL